MGIYRIGLIALTVASAASCTTPSSPRVETTLLAPVQATVPASQRTAIAAAIADHRAGKSDRAAADLRKIIESKQFDSLSSAEQRDALFFSAVIAIDKADYKKAHLLLVQSTATESANGDDWRLRLFAAYGQQDNADAARALAVLARDWPSQLHEVNDRFVMYLVREIRKTPALAETRFEILDALSKAQWKLSAGEPSYLWMELVLQLLERGNLPRANEVAQHIAHPSILIGMRADNRFVDIVQANPTQFDIDRAVALDIQYQRNLVQSQPRSLEAIKGLTYSLLSALQFTEVLQITTATLAKATSAPKNSPAFDDLDTQLNWIIDNRVRALKRLGRWEEAARELSVGANLQENGNTNVSQAINLGALYCNMGRHKEALRAIAKVQDVSGYGRMQIEGVKLCVAVQTIDTDEVNRTLSYMAKNRSDAESSYQSALVDANRLEDAARVLIARIADPELRFDALTDIQDQPNPGATPYLLQLEAKWKTLVGRNDVQTAVAKVGKIEKYNFL